MRNKFEIPEAGKQLVIPITGRAVIVEDCNVYKSVEEVPLIGFRPGNNQYPIYPRSTYSNNGQEFNSLIVVGTEESAGDEVTLFGTPECLDSSININLESTRSREYIAGAAIRKVMDGTIQSFTEKELANENNYLPLAINLYNAGTGDINYLFEDEGPEVGGKDLVLKEGGEPIKVIGIDNVLNLRFINAALDEQDENEEPTLIAIPEFLRQ